MVRAALFESQRRREEKLSQFAVRREQEFAGADKYLNIPSTLTAFILEEMAGLFEAGHPEPPDAHQQHDRLRPCGGRPQDLRRGGGAAHEGQGRQGQLLSRPCQPSPVGQHFRWDGLVVEKLDRTTRPRFATWCSITRPRPRGQGRGRAGHWRGAPRASRPGPRLRDPPSRTLVLSGGQQWPCLDIRLGRRSGN